MTKQKVRAAIFTAKNLEEAYDFAGKFLDDCNLVVHYVDINPKTCQVSVIYNKQVEVVEHNLQKMSKQQIVGEAMARGIDEKVEKTAPKKKGRKLLKRQLMDDFVARGFSLDEADERTTYEFDEKWRLYKMAEEAGISLYTLGQKRVPATKKTLINQILYSGDYIGLC